MYFHHGDAYKILKLIHRTSLSVKIGRIFITDTSTKRIYKPQNIFVTGKKQKVLFKYFLNKNKL